ncbi:MAG: hypothetical protein EOP49_35725 [Sphingobacteriales bacterium]|nr:MAG: hypothetical protein EOP49_35725 [Sphingobacteriales bacterium]
MNSKRTRKVKIYSKFRGGGWRLCDHTPKEVPWLTVSGKKLRCRWRSLEIKRRLSMEAVLQHYGLQWDTYCCFSANCTAGTGDVIQLIQLKESR